MPALDDLPKSIFKIGCGFVIIVVVVLAAVIGGIISLWNALT